MILLRLFISFLQIGLFSIGGGYAAMPLIREQTVMLNGWLSMREFADLVTIAEMTPGPIAINAATFVGMRVAGLPGALAATAGNILPSIVIVSLLSLLYCRYKEMPLLKSVLASLRPAVVALIASAGLSILMQVAFTSGVPAIKNLDIVGIALFALAFIAIRRFKCHPILAMALCGVGRLALALIADFFFPSLAVFLSLPAPM